MLLQRRLAENADAGGQEDAGCAAQVPADSTVASGPAAGVKSAVSIDEKMLSESSTCDSSSCERGVRSRPVRKLHPVGAGKNDCCPADSASSPSISGATSVKSPLNGSGHDSPLQSNRRRSARSFRATRSDDLPVASPDPVTSPKHDGVTCVSPLRQSPRRSKSHSSDTLQSPPVQDSVSSVVLKSRHASPKKTIPSDSEADSCVVGTKSSGVACNHLPIGDDVTASIPHEHKSNRYYSPAVQDGDAPPSIAEAADSKSPQKVTLSRRSSPRKKLTQDVDASDALVSREVVNSVDPKSELLSLNGSDGDDTPSPEKLPDMPHTLRRSTETVKKRALVRNRRKLSHSAEPEVEVASPKMPGSGSLTRRRNKASQDNAADAVASARRQHPNSVDENDSFSLGNFGGYSSAASIVPSGNTVSAKKRTAVQNRRKSADVSQPENKRGRVRSLEPAPRRKSHLGRPSRKSDVVGVDISSLSVSEQTKTAPEDSGRRMTRPRKCNIEPPACGNTEVGSAEEKDKPEVLQDERKLAIKGEFMETDSSSSIGLDDSSTVASTSDSVRIWLLPCYGCPPVFILFSSSTNQH